MKQGDEFTSHRKKVLHYLMERAALELLARRPVISVDQFEGFLGKKFRHKIDALGLDKPLKSGRTEWKNLTDWIKARLTMRRDTRYLQERGGVFIVYLRNCGQVDGNALVRMSDARKVIEALRSLTVQEARAARIRRGKAKKAGKQSP